MTTVLITGANRGLGLEFVKQYAARGFEVLATCRNLKDAEALQVLAQKPSHHVKIYPLDVTKADSIKTLVNMLQGKPIDILLHNAGTLGNPKEMFGEISSSDMLTVFNTNCVGPLKLSEALLPQLLQSELKTIVAVSSSMGSIASNESGGYYTYRVSKAALNAVLQSMAIDLAPQGIRVLALHPGWVKTRMGGEGALISPEESVQGMCKVIDDEVRLPAPGFYRYDGQMIPF